MVFHSSNVWSECALIFICIRVSSSFSTRQLLDRESQVVSVNNISHLWPRIWHQYEPTAKRNRVSRNIINRYRSRENVNLSSLVGWKSTNLFRKKRGPHSVSNITVRPYLFSTRNKSSGRSRGHSVDYGHGRGNGIKSDPRIGHGAEEGSSRRYKANEYGQALFVKALNLSSADRKSVSPNLIIRELRRSYENRTSAKYQTHSKQIVINTGIILENYEKQTIAAKLRHGFSSSIFGKSSSLKRNNKTDKATLRPYTTTVDHLLPINTHVPKRRIFLKEKTIAVSFENAFNNSTKPASRRNDDKPKCSGGYRLNFLTNSSRTGALCLDGSPPGYYYRPGRGNGTHKWIIFIQGGAWCENAFSCLKRSHTVFGSSHLFPVCMNGEGLLSPDPKYNPDFYNWTFVFIAYCDGSSFTGNRVTPLQVKDKTLYLRGKLIMKALIDELMRSKGLQNATEVIFGGRSAGGLAAIIHANYVRNRLSRSTSFRVLSDAGFFVDSPTSDGKELIRSKMKQVFYFHNSSGGLNRACIRAQTLNERWKCFFPQYSTSFVKAPLYLINPLYDLWQIVYLQGIECAKKMDTCDETDRQKVLDFRNKTLNALTSVFINRRCAGYFDSCLAHSQTVLNDVWGVVRVRNVTMSTAFSQWYFGKLKRNERFRIDGTYPCNHSCPSKVVL